MARQGSRGLRIFAHALLVSGVPVSSACLCSSGAFAAAGDCGQPQSAGAEPGSTDCLFILQASIELTTCDPTCICDVVGSDGIAASDALVCLQSVVGNGFPFDCPSGWNWALVSSDGRSGVHNPSFVLGVLDASIDALER